MGNTLSQITALFDLSNMSTVIEKFALLHLSENHNA
ncbi:hypothetical protein PSGL111025_04720 [Psychrobacter glaciei]